MTIDFNAAALAYLRYVLKVTDQSATALARQAGISSTTLTRPLNNPDHKFTITTKTIEKIAAVSGISPAPFFEAKNLAELNLGAHPTKVANRELWDIGEWENGNIQVIGAVEVGVWREIGPEPAYNLYVRAPLPFLSTEYKQDKCFAVEVRDTSVNNHARAGDFLFCRKSKHESDARADDLVIIETRKENDLLYELEARRLRYKRGKWFTEIESTDPRFEKLTPLYYGEDDMDSPTSTPPKPAMTRIRILGVVEWVFRPVTEM